MPGKLTHQPCAVIRRLLVDKGMGTDPSKKGAWPVFEAGEPDEPDSSITVYSTTGVLQGRVQIDGETMERHGIEVMFRAAGASNGWARARAVAEFFDKVVYNNTVHVGPSRYVVQSVGRTSDVLPLGKEPGTKRSLFSLNALVTLRQVA